MRGQLQIAESLDPTAVLDTFDVDHSGETVKRQILALGGSTDDALVEPTNAAPAAGAYGVPMRVGDGHDANAGATTDAAALAGAAGSLSAKLRRLTSDLGTLLTAIQAGITTVLGAGENHVGQVGGTSAVPTATFSRPANTTAYVSGQLVANNTVAGSVAPMQFTVARVAAGSGTIRRARLRKSGTSITNASFRLHLYKTSPTPANGDGAAWSTDQAANYLGSFDITMDKAFTDGAAGNGIPTVGSDLTFALASGQIVYGLLEARAGYTPVSGESFTAALEVLQN